MIEYLYANGPKGREKKINDKTISYV